MSHSRVFVGNVSVRLVRGKEEAGRPIVVLSHLKHCRLFHICRFLSDFFVGDYSRR